MLSQTGSWPNFKRWVVLIVVSILLFAIGWFIHTIIEGILRQQLSGQLRTLLNADVKALKLWYGNQKSVAELIADQPDVRADIAELVNLNKKHPGATDKLLKADAQENLRDNLSAICGKSEEYVSYSVVDRENMRVIGNLYDEPVGQQPDANIPKFSMEKLLKDEIVVTAPYRCPIPIPGEDKKLQTNRPTIFVITPIKDEKKVIAYLAFRIRPEVEFTRILTVAQFGESGETYAFNREGLMLTESKFDEQLRKVGLLEANTPSSLSLYLKNPGADLTKGNSPTAAPHKQEFTKPVRLVDKTSSNLGSDINGYRDYRGVWVIGVWQWLPEHDFGVVTEVDVDEAYAPLRVIRWVFLGLICVVVISILSIILSSFVQSRLLRKIQSAEQHFKQLGQYKLVELIGKGGMGEVYKAKHAFLQRPTAVKVLRPDQSGDRAVVRFEREVQMTSRLTHPNTIAVYDFGHTKDGEFYYVMEFLTGITLEDLVQQFGPQPESRVIAILQQVCNSLEEAHGIGLIHRDIKPANIMLCQYGGQYDFVKVLDFGLVKDISESGSTGNTTTNFVVGTPQYLSPEAISHPETVNPARDVYAVGVTGYFLLTGKQLFDEQHPMQLFRKHMDSPPVPPSERVGWQLDSDLEEIILRCLEKDPEKRFPDMESLWKAMNKCQHANQWDRDNARQWWQENEGFLNLQNAQQSDPDETEMTTY